VVEHVHHGHPQLGTGAATTLAAEPDRASGILINGRVRHGRPPRGRQGPGAGVHSTAPARLHVRVWNTDDDFTRQTLIVATLATVAPELSSGRSWRHRLPTCRSRSS
jgi:hypothetical protein